MKRMRQLVRIFLAGVLTIAFASAAHAQSERRIGVVVAYPSSVGVQWQAAGRLAIRFDADYSQVNNESTSEFPFSRFVPGLPPIAESFEVTTKTRSRNIELGVSLLFDVHRGDDLRIYVAPRVAVNFGHTSFETTFSGNPAVLAAITFAADSDADSQSPGGGVSMGASHDLGARFRVFGEAGFSYLRGAFSGAAGDDVKSTSLGLRGGVGAVVLF
jgi:hypothetical protein